MLCLLTFLLMKKIKTTFFLLLFFCLTIPVNRAQNIYINFKDGSHAQYALTDIRKITVAGDTMRLSKMDGTTLSWPESTIGNYNYKGLLYGMNEPEPVSLYGAFVFPNPGIGPFTIQYHLQKKTKVVIDLLDIQGKKIRQLNSIMQPAGLNQILWDGLDSNGNPPGAGVYLCKISNDNTFIIKRILIN